MTYHKPTTGERRRQALANWIDEHVDDLGAFFMAGFWFSCVMLAMFAAGR